MTWFDAVVLAAAVFIAVVGWRAGASYVILSVLLTVAGLVAAVTLLPRLVLQTSPSDVTLRHWLLHGGFLLLPFAGFTVGRSVAMRTRRSAAISDLSRVVGSVIAVVTLGVVVWFLSPLSDRSPALTSWSTGSSTADILEGIGDPPVDINRLVAQDSFPIGFARLLGPLDVGPPPTDLPPVEPAALANAEQASVQISHTGCGGYTVGSGFAIASDMIVTNAHVVAGTGGEVDIRAATTTTTGTVVAFDQSRDLALVRIENRGGPFIAISSRPAEPGAIVVTLGHPAGEERLDVSPARVVERKYLPIVVDGRRPSEPLAYVLASDDIKPGSSGSAVINDAGEAVAIVFAGPEDGEDYALAVATEELDAVLDTVSGAAVGVADCP